MLSLSIFLLCTTGAVLQTQAMPMQRRAAAPQKILCLHGGGGTGTGFQNAPGMQALMASLPQYEFVFPDGGYSSGGGNLWIRDPPNGKDVATTSADWADDSFAVLDRMVATQGPFYGILGYSQGSAFVPVYLAHAPVGTFKVAFMFCGYLTTTHQGLMGLVDTNAPFGNIPALVWQGARDGVITNSMTAGQAAKFASPTVLTSVEAGHYVPAPGDPTYSQVVAFMGVSTRGGGGGGGGGAVIGGPSTATFSCDQMQQQQCEAAAGCTWYIGHGCHGAESAAKGSKDAQADDSTGTEPAKDGSKDASAGGTDVWVCGTDGFWYQNGQKSQHSGCESKEAVDTSKGTAKDNGATTDDGTAKETATATQKPAASQKLPTGAPTAGAATCIVLRKAAVAYNGPIVAKFNNADGATPITDVAKCAQKCAENAECTYFAVNKSPSKGCVLKSNRRGSPVKNAAFVGHGTCEHAVPDSCATTGKGRGWSKFKKNNLGSYKNIKNEGGCAQKCESNAECKYWLVHNRLGCVLNTEGKGKMQNKKGYMFHGTC